jgi:hypothetical protein
MNKTSDKNGAGSWTLNVDIAERLATFERKLLRIMFGLIKINENWRKEREY